MAEVEEEIENEEEVDAEDGAEDDDLDAEFDDGEFAGDTEFAEDEDEDEDNATAVAAKAAAKASEEDDDDEPDPDDVEEDLDVILKDRLASGDGLDEEEEDDEDQVVAPPINTTEGDKVAPKGDDEWTCHGCFLIVSKRQFGKRSTATCPSGVGDCPSLEML